MAQKLLTKALVLRATNYLESDKIITLFSLELGKVGARLTGCNKPTAKLKFAGQPFCLAEFELIKTGELFKVTNASEMESFFDLSLDYQKMLAGSVVLESCDAVTQPEPAPTLFVETLKALKSLCFSELSPRLVLIKFFLELFSITGYRLGLDRCKNCGGHFSTHVLLDLNSGSLVCGLCRGLNNLEMSQAALAGLKLVAQTDYARLGSITLKDQVISEILILFGANFLARFNHSLKSLKSLIKLK